MSQSSDLPLRALVVADIMATDVITVRSDDRLAEVHTTMRLAGIRHAPVLDEDGVLVGVVSDRDLQLAWSQGPDTLVSAFMSRDIEQANPQTLARDAAARMLKDKIGSLPVVDDAGNVVGIVTATDFLVVAHQALEKIGVADD